MLWLLILIPAVGALITAMLPTPDQAKKFAIGVTGVMAIVGLILLVWFPYEAGGWYFQSMPGGHSWLTLPTIGFHLGLGVDAISLFLVLTTIVMMPVTLAAGFDNIVDRPKQYYACLLTLMSAMLGVFIARDILLFYVFFELTLIPFFFLIGVWGGPERRPAAVKFFLYTFSGSMLMLASVVYLGVSAHSFDIGRITAFAQTQMTDSERFWVVLGLLAGLVVKVPLFPIHSWLPAAQTQGSTAAAVFLAGELGAYGVLRLAMPIGFVGSNGIILFPSLIAAIGVLCVISIIYAAMIAWVQLDMKTLVAYASISHLGVIMLGLMAFNAIGMQGAVLYMVNHGLSFAGLFLCIGMIYDRYHTRNMNELSGLGRVMPKMSFFFMLFCLSAVGLPGLNGFPSEFLTLLGAFTSPHLGVGFGSMATIGVVLSAVYLIHMLARVIFGPVKVPDLTAEIPAADDRIALRKTGDLTRWEIGILTPLAVLVVVLGIVPSALLQPMLAPINRIRMPMSSDQIGAHHSAMPIAIVSQPTDRSTAQPTEPSSSAAGSSAVTVAAASSVEEPSQEPAAEPLGSVVRVVRVFRVVAVKSPSPTRKSL